MTKCRAGFATDYTEGLGNSLRIFRFRLLKAILPDSILVCAKQLIIVLALKTFIGVR